MENRRVYFYDYIKTIAIYLVCLYHFGTLNYEIVDDASPFTYFNYFFLGLSSVGVPLFFLVNGALLLNKPDYNLNNHIFRILKIAFLFVVWGTITLLIEAVKFDDHYTVKSFIKGLYFMQQGRSNHLWFLVAMIYIYLFFPMIKALFDNKDERYIAYLLTIIFLFTFGVYFINDLLNIAGYFLNSNTLKNIDIWPYVWFNPFNVYFSYNLFYFVIGGVLAKRIKTFVFEPLALISLLLFGGVCLFLFGFVKTDINHGVFDTVWNGYNTITTLVMSVAIFLLCSKIQISNIHIKKIVTTISANTLGIYFVHVPLGYYLVSYYYQTSISNNFFFDLAFAGLIMALSLIIVLVLKRIPLVKELVKI